MEFRKPIMLWKTIVGSHMWHMETPTSDLDFYIAQIADIKSILLGNTHNGGHTTQTEIQDETRFEIGHIIRELSKGNLNHVFGIMSPITEYTTDVYRTLHSLLQNNPIKGIYHSTKGMAKHNITHFIEQKRGKVADTQGLLKKKLGTIIRNLQFGITLLETGKYVFKKPEIITAEQALMLFEEIDNAYENSALPEKMPEDLLDDYLITIRKLYN